MEKVTDSIYAIGATDNDIDLFESQYKVPEGVSYNSYLIRDDKNTVMDTIDARRTEEWLANLEKALDGETVDYLVVQHMEPDHSASVAKLAEMYPEMKIVGNPKTFNMLSQFFNMPDLDERKIVVKEGDELNTGKHTLKFVMAPMVHWPEVMVTYDKADKVLFSADGFGRFGQPREEEPWDEEARRYYCNICGKYGGPVGALLKKAAGLDIEIIAPLHGPVLTHDLGHYLDLYKTWSSGQPEEKGILVAYASIHGNTARAAREFARSLESLNVPVCAMDLTREDKAQAVGKAFQYPVIVLMASSYDAGVFTPMEAFLRTLQAKALHDRKFAIVENGSWAPSAAKTIKGLLEPLKNCTLIEPVVTIRSTPNEATREQLDVLKEHIGQALNENC